MERYLTVLNSYERMSPELEQTLRDNVRAREVRKDEIIQDIGTFTDNLYFVEKGLFRLYDIRSDGKDVTFRFKREDQFIVCLKEVFSIQMSVADGIQALEPGHVWIIPASLISQLQQEYPQFRTQLSTIITDDYIALTRSGYSSHALGGASNYDDLRRDSPELIGRVPVPYLANHLKISERKLRKLR